MVSSSNPFGRFSATGLAKAIQGQRGSFEKLSSGKAINKASDDPAGLSVLSQLDASVVSLKQATRNIGDTVSALSIADGATDQIQNITTRLSELATQSANGTLSDDQRKVLQDEYSALSQEVQRIGETTQFNGNKLLDGGSITTQVGTDSSEASQVTATSPNIQALAADTLAQNIGTQEGARNALASITQFSESLSQAQGGAIGAVQSRLESAQSNLQYQTAGTQEAASRIGDVDVAEEAAKLTKAQILTQVSSAVLSQSANLDRDRVKALLG
jgi:flagellin